ncbi:Uncharacterized protein TCM_037246 [Theobroma cacao]|uniref:Uncharacterized protein n=1 Tax=Theobroma cacao TaxID=3641 RepID=A0A061GJX3_THECC|nr:Uncharacterized protein TCM_037246 [Theobroma cacao]
MSEVRLILFSISVRTDLLWLRPCLVRGTHHTLKQSKLNASTLCFPLILMFRTITHARVNIFIFLLPDYLSGNTGTSFLVHIFRSKVSFKNRK